MTQVAPAESYLVRVNRHLLISRIEKLEAMPSWVSIGVGFGDTAQCRDRRESARS